MIGKNGDRHLVGDLDSEGVLARLQGLVVEPRKQTDALAERSSAESILMGPRPHYPLVDRNFTYHSSDKWRVFFCLLSGAFRRLAALSTYSTTCEDY